MYMYYNFYRYGFVIAVTTIDHIGAGLIQPGRGFVLYPIKVCVEIIIDYGYYIYPIVLFICEEYNYIQWKYCSILESFCFSINKLMELQGHQS